MAVTIGATFLALAVVLVFIGYRVFNAGGSGPASVPVLGATTSLSKGARIVSTTAAEGRIMVTIETPEGTEIRSYDANTMKETGRLRFMTAP